MGTIGDRGAMDLMAFVTLADQLPSLQSIKDNPKSAKVPDSAAAVCMVVYRHSVRVGQRLAQQLDGLLASPRYRSTRLCSPMVYAHRSIQSSQWL